jgi:hypothetical protein
MRSITTLAGATLLALFAGCAGAPATQAVAAATVDCAQLGADIAAVEDAQRQAQAARDGAWKAAVPIAVAARYATSSSAVAEARQRLDTLHAEAGRLGCPAITTSAQGRQP